MDHAFRILNVFTVHGLPLTGNPLCVFERGEQLTEVQMQELARQFNLSETTFILPPTSSEATARVRIFTPTFEMPFAGHPTLGSAHVVRALRGEGDRVVLEMKAGLIEVNANADAWTLRAAYEPRTRRPTATKADIAGMLGLAEEALAGEPRWVDTGAEQLVIPLRTPDDVRAARPIAELLARDGFNEKRGSSMAYVWSRVSDSADSDVLARFFFLVNGGVVEDPATGSACANLGGWMLSTGHALPVALRVSQGHAVGRPSALRLDVDSKRRVFVTGAVFELGRGTIAL